MKCFSSMKGGCICGALLIPRLGFARTWAEEERGGGGVWCSLHSRFSHLGANSDQGAFCTPQTAGLCVYHASCRRCMLRSYAVAGPRRRPAVCDLSRAASLSRNRDNSPALNFYFSPFSRSSLLFLQLQQLPLYLSPFAEKRQSLNPCIPPSSCDAPYHPPSSRCSAENHRKVLALPAYKENFNY